MASAVAALGYEEPTPVQRETIPVILGGSDLLAQAATGTGKTAAFALPMIQLLTAPPPASAAGPKKPVPHTSGVVLVPTRELAMQVSEAIHKYAAGTRMTVVPLGDIPNRLWRYPCAFTGGQQAFGHALLAAHDFVAIPSAVSRRSWNLVFDADRVAGKYVLKAQEALDLDPRLDPPSR